MIKCRVILVDVGGRLAVESLVGPAVIVYSLRITLRIQDVKFEAHAGREFRAKLGESIKEIEDGGFELAFGAVKGGVYDFGGGLK